MIPKIIHYCWFGNGEKSELIQKCIQSWKTYYPDFTFMEWNEENFDVDAYRFSKTASEKKKWAFVSDIARLVVLEQYGGIYLDTDVEVFDSNFLRQYLEYDTVLTFENERRLNTGMFCACEKGSKIFREFIEAYKDLDFIGNHGQINTVMNHPMIKKNYPSLLWNNETQIIGKDIILSTKEYEQGMKHYGQRSWLDHKVEYIVSKDSRLKRMLRNPKIFQKLENSPFLRIYEFISYDLLDMGPIYFMKRQIKKIKDQ